MMDDLKLIRPGEIRVRIAPSPTGALHIGVARTALFNYLFAKKYQGIFVLRIEDTDIERSKSEWEKEIIEGLKWLGLDFEEGPEAGGDYGPYRQSQRGEIYKKYIEKLLEEKKIYYCFCSPEELEARRNYLMSIGEIPRYSGKCRNLSENEIKKNLKTGQPYVLRFKVPSKKVVFQDLLRGKIEYDTDIFGDIAIAKNLITPLYNLASVIDDFEMKITHIIRGEDHIPNTPKQILIAEALEIEKPKYLHLPLILGSDRAKLSKRHNVKSVMEYKKEGYLPEALVNFLAFLGWNPGTEREIFSLSSLIQGFFLEGIQKSGAIFNHKKLDWLNSFCLRQKSKEKLTELCLPYLIQSGLIEPYSPTEKPPKKGLLSPGKDFVPRGTYDSQLSIQRFKTKDGVEEIPFEYLVNVVSLYQERLKKLSEISELTDFFFKEKLDYPKELLRWTPPAPRPAMTDKEVENSIDKLKKLLDKIKPENWTKENIQISLLKLAAEAGEGDRGRILWPLRVALTGKKASAGPFEVAEVLGKEKTLARIKEARKKLT